MTAGPLGSCTAMLCPFRDTVCHLTTLLGACTSSSVLRVNADHQQLCGSPEWIAFLHDDLLPRLVAGVDLGHEMLELGPGPGGATEWLRHRVRRLTAIELDPVSAQKLDARFPDGNVSIVRGDCAHTDLADESFDSVCCFTMLHHVASAALQHAVLAEAFRLLRPGGVLIGSDSLASNELRLFHAGDTYNPIEPAILVGELQAIGFAPITLRIHEELTFVAHKPTVHSLRQR